MRASVYVDGLNLYYGALKGTRYKWLNPATLCELLLPRFDVCRIKYFTALVRARPDKPDQRVAQHTTVRTTFVRVVKTEEKGSDVNIASHMLLDGFRGAYDAAVLVTNDSDLIEPIRIVREELGLMVGILNPHKRASVLALQSLYLFLLTT